MGVKIKSKVYHTEVELALSMINFVHKFSLAAECVTFATWYTFKAMLSVLRNYGYAYAFIG
jgi:hypothetical protein